MPRSFSKTLLTTTALTLFAIAAIPGAPAMAATQPDATQPVAAKTTTQDGYTVAILPFTYSTKEKSFEDMGSEVQQLLTAYLSAQPSIMLVERAEVDKALSEVELGMSGNVDPDTAAKVGHLTGAQILVTGRIFPVRDDIVMVGKIIGIETGRVYGVTVTFPANAKITKAAEEISQKIGDNISEKGETMIAHVENKETLIGKLKPKLAGLKLPTVSIEITEKDISPDVMSSNHGDAAHASLQSTAQTEMGYTLKQLGFDVVDIAESNKHADIEVSGEAFSEFALRKGNLVSAKSRVEIKAIRKSDGKVLEVDRQNGVAVDLALESAGKAAIAKSAEALTGRLVETILTTIKP